MKQMKQIYALRGLGVLLVVMFHWLFHSRMDILSSGPVAIDIFFVLSGFFITNILLEGRDKAEANNIKKRHVFKLFLLNRALRIFPIYYITIFLLYFFHESTDTSIKANFVYFLTYTSNFYFYNIQSWDGVTSHLWSLAVEEQFYIFWPFVVLLINRKWLPYVIAMFVIIGFVSHYFLSDNEFGMILPFACFDALGIGALLSWINLYRSQYLKQTMLICASTFLGCLLYFFSARILYGKFPLSPDLIFSSVAAFVISYVVYAEKAGVRIKFRVILENHALIFLGKLCYGLYLYHNILPHYLMLFMERFQVYRFMPAYVLRHYDLLSHVINFVLLIGISWLSWKYIEKPILSLKKKFNPKEQLVKKTEHVLAA